MSPAVEALTPHEANALVMSPMYLAQWLDANDVAWERSLMSFGRRSAAQ